MTAYSIEELKPKDFAAWNAFVLGNEKASVFHSIEWKQLQEQTFGFKPFYFIVKDSKGKVVGIAPAFHCRRFFSRGIISMPFFEYGGPIIENGFEEAGKEIFELYKKQVEFGNAGFVSVKQPPKGIGFSPKGYFKSIDASGYFLDIAGKDFEKDIFFGLWKKDSGIRTEVRKAEKHGIKVDFSQAAETLFRLALKKDERLGSPSFPKEYYTNLQTLLEKQLHYETALHNGKAIASMVSIAFNKTLLLHQLGNYPNSFELASNEVLFTKTIEWACKNGMQKIDFGRSQSGSSHASFKKKFGAKEFDIFSFDYPKRQGSRYSLKSLSGASAKIPFFWKAMAKTGMSFWLKKRMP